MNLPLFDPNGSDAGTIEADDAVFGIEPNLAVVHQAYTAQMANRRAGSANTKRRHQVRASGAKLRRQKGLGRARAGSAGSSLRVGGGVAHGPSPRSFRQGLPRKMRRLAIRSLLSDRAANGHIIVVRDLVPAEPKTRLLHATLDALHVDRGALVVSAEPNETLARAGRNLPYATVVAASYLNVVALTNCHKIVLTEDAVRAIESLWGERAAAREEVA